MVTARGLIKGHTPDQKNRYGILVNPLSWASVFVHDPMRSINQAIFGSLGIFLSLPVGIEKLAAKGHISHSVARWLEFGGGSVHIASSTSSPFVF